MTFQLHVNTIDEQNAPGYSAPLPPERKRERPDLRESILCLWDVCQMAKSWRAGFTKIKNLETLMYYGLEVWSRRKKMPIDVPALVAEWKRIIVVLCTAHTKDEIDKAEYQMDELLTPILKAPVAQLREFYGQLRDALKEDERIPFFIWSMFNAWGAVMVDEASDVSKAKALRKKLASEIAEMVEPTIKPDITAAVVGALMWRNPETLEEIKSDLKAGATPRLRGRESCLFLVTTKGRGAKARELHTVML